MRPRVLFLCTGNSCRSQMAEGLLRHFAGDAIEVQSAGTHPIALNPDAVAAMKEIGIDISHHASKSLESLRDQSFDYVITVCDHARESCPTFPTSRTMHHWSFKDPGSVEGSLEERQRVFRYVRDEIAKQVRRFLRVARR